MKLKDMTPEERVAARAADHDRYIRRKAEGRVNVRRPVEDTKMCVFDVTRSPEDNRGIRQDIHELATMVVEQLNAESMTPEARKSRAHKNRVRYQHTERGAELNREYQRRWLANPENKAKRAAYNKRPDVVARRKELTHTPEWRAKNAEYQRKRYAEKKALAAAKEQSFDCAQL